MKKWRGQCSVMKKSEQVRIGLYRHFKGQYYYVTSLSRSATDEKTVMVNYFNICHPEYGSYVRPVYDFLADNDMIDFDEEGDPFGVGKAIHDRLDNVTGQYRRFERVKDLNFQISSVSTEQLIDELCRRKDSPIHELDIEGLRSPVYCSDYVVGIKYPAVEERPAGIDTLNVFDNEEKAREFFSKQPAKARKSVFKRTFIDVL